MGTARASSPGGVDAIEVGHLQVHDDHIRPVQDGLADGGLAGGGLAHDLHFGQGGQCGLQPLADQGVVVGDQDPGRSCQSQRQAGIDPATGRGGANFQGAANLGDAFVH